MAMPDGVDALLTLASAARADWGFKPAYDLTRAFETYLMPEIRQRYTSKQGD